MYFDISYQPCREDRSKQKSIYHLQHEEWILKVVAVSRRTLSKYRYGVRNTDTRIRIRIRTRALVSP